MLKFYIKNVLNHLNSHQSLSLLGCKIGPIALLFELANVSQVKFQNQKFFSILNFNKAF
jgi:hypothetical protein